MCESRDSHNDTFAIEMKYLIDFFIFDLIRPVPNMCGFCLTLVLFCLNVVEDIRFLVSKIYGPREGWRCDVLFLRSRFE